MSTESKSERIIPANMPAGYAREEAKKLVTDQQAEAIEHLAGDDAAFDPSILSMDSLENEIVQNYNQATNAFEVTDAVKGYAYLWGRFKIGDQYDHQSHFEIMSRVQTELGNRVPGYELVSGPQDRFPECWHLRQADGTRRIGDCQLYRVRSEIAAALEVRRSMRAKAKDLGVSSNILAAAGRRARYVNVYETEGDPAEYMKNRAQIHGGMSRQQYDQEMVMTLAQHKMSEDARAGRLYGIPVQRAVRKS